MSAVSIPKTGKSWTVDGRDGFESLKLIKEAPIPEVSDYDVLVKFHAASLNYRDLLISKGGALTLLSTTYLALT
jgi:NADPH:quinone reductase-like Zn-dependent oxidoreductase